MAFESVLSTGVSASAKRAVGVSAKVSYFEGDRGRSYNWEKIGGFLSLFQRAPFCRLPVPVTEKKADTGMRIPSCQITKVLTLDAGNAHALSSHTNDAAVDVAVSG